jgi:zinc protease
MPNQYDYSLEFYRRYYRPEYTTILLVGDVTRQRALTLTQKYFGDWKRGNYAPVIPPEPAQTAPRQKHIDWPSPALPQIVIAFHGPAYADDRKDKIALDLLAQIAFGENSELYQRLVLKEQKVESLSVNFGDQVDPELFSVFARLKDPKDLADVRQQILGAFQRYRGERVSAEQLNATRSRLRYGTALGLDSSTAVAGFLAPYVALRRTPETIDRLFELSNRITPQDLRDCAARYFTEANRTIVTLATQTNAKP